MNSLTQQKQTLTQANHPPETFQLHITTLSRFSHRSDNGWEMQAKQLGPLQNLIRVQKRQTTEISTIIA